MKLISFSVLFLIPALAATAQSAPRQQKETPVAREQLRTEAAAIEQQVKANPADTELYMKLGFAYSRLEQADDAQRAFEGAVNLEPKKAAAHYMLGLIYEKKGLRDKAIAAWKACLDNTQDPRMRDTATRHLHHLSHR
ncbi:MAG: hypothetical protein A2234_06320 [Elusimicrobia bacterium RIFOXYA2_FULL_58_8]|nr:MAG: hypothetical protein A2285_07635 [Elusimicrobia bacterium RIFOXYA12_FULL_57_11]OGS17416.1 MAG: hypothetical protein A2234_06320 [Elusimicrobia bacterium RIFOXYA2_FULL_58_8]